jgi:hypothetical protein
LKADHSIGGAAFAREPGVNRQKDNPPVRTTIHATANALRPAGGRDASFMLLLLVPSVVW